MTGDVGAKPRLLVLASTFPRWRDDPEPAFVHELAKRLIGAFEVTVLCPHAEGASPQEVMEGVRVRRFHYAPARMERLVNNGGIVTNLRRYPFNWLLVPGFLLGLAWNTWKLIRAESPDVVHAHWLLPQGLAVAMLSVMSRQTPPFVVTSHGADIYALRSAPIQRLKSFVIRRAAAVTLVSSAMRKHAAALGAPDKLLSVMPMGTDLRSRFVTKPLAERDTDRLLFVGRLVPKKGMRYLLDAMPRILAQRPAVVLDVVGFGPEEASLREQAERLGIDEHVRFLGARPQAELPDLYRRAALFVAPFVKDESGDQEGLPVALMEAVGCGCPVVAGDVAGIDDLLGEAASRVCVNPRNADALASVVLRVMDDPAGAAVVAEEIRQSALERVDWESIAARYQRLLMECRRNEGR